MAVRQTSRKKKSAGAGLALSVTRHSSAARVFELLKERDRLVRQVEKQRGAVQRATERARVAENALMAKLAPLRERDGALRGEIKALFQELLAERRLSARARREVLKFRRFLRREGFLDDDGESESDRKEPGESADQEQPESAAWGSFDDAQRDGASSERDVASAAQHGQSAGRETLRNLFRRLVLAIHPDRARHEAEREARTSAMKEATRAYEDGDLARLMELEKAWRAGEPVAADVDDGRARELERANRELRAQLAHLTRTLRQIKRAMPPTATGPEVALVCEQAEHGLKMLASVRNFIRSFRDGKLSLSEFAEGPVDVLLELEFLSDLAEHPFYAPGPAPRTRSGRSRGATKSR